MTRHRLLCLLAALAFAGHAGAQVGGIILSPGSVPAGSGSFALTVGGVVFSQSGNCAAPRVIWVVGQAETALQTTLNSNGTVTAIVPASLVAQQTTLPITVKVRSQILTTGTVGGCLTTDSPSAPFFITTPSFLASCNNPPVATVGQQYSHVLAATGGVPPYIWTAKNIAPQVVLSTNGTISGVFLPTDAPYVSFTANVRDSLSASEYNTAQVTCQIQVQAQPAPVITGYFPTEATACGPEFTLSVSGTGFTSGSQLGIGGPDVYNRLATTVASATSLTGTVTRDRIATAGTTNIAVANPAATESGYVFSDPRPFNVRRTPVIQALNPARIAVGSADLRVTVTGTDFASSLTRILWQSGTTTETFNPDQTTATQLTVTLPRRLFAAVGKPVVRVVNVETANPRGTPYTDSCSPPFTFSIDPTTLAVDNLQLPPGRVGVDYRATITATGGTKPYTFSLLSTPVPGLTISPDGTYGGRPTQAGTYTVTVQAADSSSPQQKAQRDFSLRIDPPTLQIASPDALPDGRVGTDYSATFTATGGAFPYRWGPVPGSSPVPGLTLNADGTLTGRPTQTGTFTLRVQVSDNASPAQTAQRDYSIRILPPALAVTTPTAAALPAATVGSDYSVTFAATGGTPPYRWDLQSGSVAGLSMSAAGVLSGRPTVNGNFTLGVRVTDSTSTPVVRQYTLAVGLAAAGFTLTASQPGSPTDQPTLTLRVTSPYPMALDGRLSLSFAPNAAGLPATGYLDPAVKFASGGTTLSFSAAANATTISLSGNGGVQTGTVAGTITVTLDQLRLAGTTTDVPLTSRPSATIAVARSAPVIVAGSVQVTNVTGSGFAVELDAYSTPRDLTLAAFNFTAASGARLDGSASFSVQLGTESAAWFSGTDGRNNGSRFHLRVPFTLSGNVNALGTVSVTLGNSAGASAAVSGAAR